MEQAPLLARASPARRRRATACIASIAAVALGARHAVPRGFIGASTLAEATADDDARGSNHSKFWDAVHNGTNLTRWAEQHLNATNASSGSQKRHAALYVAELLETLNTHPYKTEKFWCDIEFSYCGRSSCTRHTKDKHGKAGVEVAACTCEPVAKGGGDYALLELADLPALSLLAQSSDFVEVMADYVHGGKSFDATKTRVCDGLSDGTFLSKLSPDRISLPASNWDDDAEIVSVQKCDADTAIAVCSGAPCYDDDRGSTKGHLTQTCLCPVYPFSADESFKLTAPDVGHMHGCRAYAFDDGECARQATSSAIEGDLLRRWSAAAVDSMSTAPHRTEVSYCRDWFES